MSVKAVHHNSLGQAWMTEQDEPGDPVALDWDDEEADAIRGSRLPMHFPTEENPDPPPDPGPRVPPPLPPGTKGLSEAEVAALGLMDGLKGDGGGDE